MVAALQVAPMLLDGATTPALARSMRLFLLKELERRDGVSFVRGALLALRQGPAGRWVDEWLQGGDPAFAKFLGQNALPRLHPLVSLPNFPAAQAALRAFLDPRTGGESIVQLGGREGVEEEEGKLIDNTH